MGRRQPLKFLLGFILLSIAVLSLERAYAADSTEYDTLSESTASMPRAEKKLGLGLILGEPTGLNGKYWLSENSALDGGLAFAFDGETALQFHADYLFHNRKLFRLNDEPLALYFGAGARIKFENDTTRFGLRVPVGLAYEFQDEPIDLAFEVAPLLDLAPRISVGVNLGVIGRYYF